VPRSARDTVIGLTPAARATSAKVTRPVARDLAGEKDMKKQSGKIHFCCCW
jgi:hypothetical protein